MKQKTTKGTAPAPESPLPRRQPGGFCGKAWATTVACLQPYLTCLLLAFAVMAVYLPVCHYEFLNYDDPINLTANDHLLQAAPSDFLYFWQQPHANLYIPLTYNLWALLAKAAASAPENPATPLEPALFHALNLLTHLVNTLLVFLIFRRVLPQGRSAWLGALFFAIHPLQVEAVAWISEFRGLLSSFWALLSIRQFLRYSQARASGQGARRDYALATLFFCLAMLSKPSVVVLPLLLGLIATLLLHRPPRQLARELLPWLVLTVPIIILTRAIQPSATLAFQPAVWQRVLIAGNAISFYLYKLLWPLSLGPDYGRTPEYVLAHGWLWLTGLLPWLLIPLLLRKASRTWIFPLAFFVVAAVPVLGFVTFDFQIFSSVTDRYLYLAMLGPAFAVALLPAHFARKRIPLVILAAILALLALQSSRQLHYWHDDFTFNRHALEVNPRSWLANNNLAFAYFSKGQPQQAIPYYEETIRLNPGNLTARTNLGDAQTALNLPREALASYQNALALSPRNPWLLFSLGETYQKLQDNQQAIAAYRLALTSKPDFLEAQHALDALLRMNSPGSIHQGDQ